MWRVIKIEKYIIMFKIMKPILIQIYFAPPFLNWPGFLKSIFDILGVLLTLVFPIIYLQCDLVCDSQLFKLLSQIIFMPAVMFGHS